MTERGRQVLQAINHGVVRDGYPPTVRGLMGTLGLASPSTVHAHLNALEAQGLIEREPGQPRALRVTTSGLSLLLLLAEMNA